MRKQKKFRKITSLITIVIMVCTIVSLVAYDSISENRLQQIKVEASQIIRKDEVVVDFSNQIAAGSPLVFGGAHAPNIEDQDAWDLIADVGVTVIRRDFYIEEELPKNITLEDYKNNVNGIQDPNKWNWSSGWTNISKANSIYENAHRRSLKVMGIVGYTPSWLSFNGSRNGVPRDWEVYKDIVKKLYKIHRNYLDYIEIWNEPDIIEFLDTRNSGLSRSEAYLKIFMVTSQAIREVDNEVNDGKKVPIIAPAVSLPNDTRLIEYLLKNGASSYLSGVSVHSYEKTEPSWATYSKIMKKYGKENLPIYVSEWNKTSKYIKGNPYTSSNLAITYTGEKLIDFLNYGVESANYYSTTYFDSNSHDKYINAFGFYTKVDSETSLLPHAKVWRVLSRKLELGKGESKIVYSNSGNSLKTIGALSGRGKPVLAFVNNEDTSNVVSITARNLPISSGQAHIDIYTASPEEDGTLPTCSENIDISDGIITFKTIAPANSVNGITISQPTISLNHLLNVLGVSTTQGCIFN